MPRLPSPSNTQPYLGSLDHSPRAGSWAHSIVAASAAFDARHLGHGLGAFEVALIAQASPADKEQTRNEGRLKQKLATAFHDRFEDCHSSIEIHPETDLTSLDIWDGIPYDEGTLQKLIIESNAAKRGALKDTKQTDTAKSATPKSDGNRGSMSVSSVLSEDNKVGVKIPDFTGTLQCAMLHNSRHLAPAITIEVKSARTSFASSLDDADFMYRLKKAACLLEASTTRPSKDSTPEVNQDLQPLLEAGDEDQILNDRVTAVPGVVDVLKNIRDIPDVFTKRLRFKYNKQDNPLFRWENLSPPPGQRQSWLDQLMQIDLREKARLGLAQTLIYSLSSHAAFGAQFGVFFCCTRFVRILTCQDTVLLDLLLPEAEMDVSDLLKRSDLADRLPHDFLLPEAMPTAWRRLNADSIQVYLNVFAASFALNDQIASECLRKPSPLSPSRLLALLNTVTKLNVGLEHHADLVAAARPKLAAHVKRLKKSGDKATGRTGGSRGSDSRGRRGGSGSGSGSGRSSGPRSGGPKRRGNLPPHDASPSGAGSGDGASGPHDASMADFGLDEELPLGAEASTYSMWNSARDRRDFETLLQALKANNPRIVIISPARMDEFLREAGNDMFSEATDTSVPAPVCDSLHTTPVRSPSTSTCGSSPVLQTPERPTAGRASDRRAGSKHMEDRTFTQTSLDRVVPNA